jgi:hypothetical protein
LNDDAKIEQQDIAAEEDTCDVDEVLDELCEFSQEETLSGHHGPMHLAQTESCTLNLLQEWLNAEICMELHDHTCQALTELHELLHDDTLSVPDVS